MWYSAARIVPHGHQCGREMRLDLEHGVPLYGDPVADVRQRSLRGLRTDPRSEQIVELHQDQRANDEVGSRGHGCPALLVLRVTDYAPNLPR